MVVGIIYIIINEHLVYIYIKSFMLNFIIFVILWIFTEKKTLMQLNLLFILFNSKLTEWRQRVMSKIKM